MSFAIITDSTSDISPARAHELGIYVIPLHVIIEGEDLLDQVQITAEEYVARMARSEQLPHTSQPSAGEFKALFDRVRADGHDSAIFISLCSEWSACYANASLTAETHELDVRCIDSRTGSGAEGLLVEYALAMREARRPSAADSPHAREPGQKRPRSKARRPADADAQHSPGRFAGVEIGRDQGNQKGPRRQAHRCHHHGRLPRIFG